MISSSMMRNGVAVENAVVMEKFFHRHYVTRESAEFNPTLQEMTAMGT